MPFFGNKSRTAEQKARAAKTRPMIRVLALFFLIFYVIVPLINAPEEYTDGMSPWVRYAIIAFFIIACIVIGVITALEYVRNKKEGKFDPSSYTDDEVDEAQESSDEIIDDEDDEDDDEYEYEDDEDEDDDEYDDED